MRNKRSGAMVVFKSRGVILQQIAFRPEEGEWLEIEYVEDKVLGPLARLTAVRPPCDPEDMVDERAEVLLALRRDVC